MNKLEHKDIICIAGVDFEPLWARTQQLILRLDQSNRVLYVETPLSILSPFKDRSLWYKWSRWMKGVRKYNQNIYLYSPPLLFPFANRCRQINRINQKIIAASLRPVCRRLGFKAPILLTYLPNTIDMLDELGEKLVVYDCVDEHSAFLGFNPEVVEQMEKELLARSDMVFVTAQPLLEDKRPFTDSIVLLRNAAETELFKQAMEDHIEIPDDVRSIPAPALGFIGRVKEWIDLDLLGQVARARPEWSLLIIGPVELDVDISPFAGLENVFFLGKRERDELPGYLKKFDVCLNPFRESRLSRAVNPLKLYEYLAAGKPIVSTPMPEIERLKGLVETGSGPEEFIEAVERALQDNYAQKAARLNFSREQSWEQRAGVFAAEIARAWESKNRPKNFKL